MGFAPFSIKLGDLIEYHYSYLHKLESPLTQMQGESTARQNFLGTPHLYHDQAKCILFFTSEPGSFPEKATLMIWKKILFFMIIDFRYIAPSGKKPGSLVEKIMHFDQSWNKWGVPRNS